MSRQNVEIARRAWTAFGEDGWDAAERYFAEDCRVEDFPEMADRAAYEGRPGLRERDAHFRESWGDFAIEPVEFVDAGGDVVVVLYALRVSGAGSGAQLDTHGAFVYEVRDGMIVRDRAFTSKSQALVAAGVR
jgi:ketosteroid isomerase-like protein